MNYWARRRLIKAIVLENAVKFLAQDFAYFGLCMSERDEKVFSDYDFEDDLMKEADTWLVMLQKEAKQLRERNEQ